MLAPRMQPRVKDSRGLTGVGIDRDHSRAFSQRTRHARERQVVDRGLASCGLGDDVIDVKRRLLVGLRDPAVLAAFGCAYPNPSLE